MPSKKAATSSPKPPKSSTLHCLQRILIGAALLAVGKWTASQYLNGWTSNKVFDYVKSTVEGQPIDPYGSTLTEPWSKVRHIV